MPATPTVLRRTATAAVATLLATGLAACGSDSSTGSLPVSGTTDSTSTSATETSTAPVATASPVAAGDAVSSDRMRQILTSAYTAIDTAHMQLTMDTAAAGKSFRITGQADMKMSPVQMAMTMQMGSYAIDARALDGTMYMKSPAFQVGDKWVEMTAKDLGAMGSGLSSSLTNPLAMVDEMAGYVSGGKVIGTETVGGASATHYEMTVDMKSLSQKLGLPASALAQVPASADENIWVDGQGRLVKTTVVVGSAETVTVLLSDFGKSVDVQAPPASEVTTAPGMGG